MARFEKEAAALAAVRSGRGDVRRLEALAKRSGERVHVSPSVAQYRRTGRFEYRSPKAYITLTFSVGPDRDVKNAVLEYDLRIVPVLWRFDNHLEFSTPIANPDLPALLRLVKDTLVRYCPICDAWEAMDQHIGVVGPVPEGLEQALDGEGERLQAAPGPRVLHGAGVAALLLAAGVLAEGERL